MNRIRELLSAPSASRRALELLAFAVLMAALAFGYFGKDATGGSSDVAKDSRDAGR